METMTKLELQQALKLLDLQNTIVIQQKKLEQKITDCQVSEITAIELKRDSNETIAQLRDELAKAKEDLRLANVAAAEESAIADKAIERTKAVERELADSQKLAESYKDELCRALACVDKVFQDGLKEPCLLPDYLRLGSDKFEAVITLANDYIATKQRAERAEREQTAIMRTYDPNADEYVYEDEINKMNGARAMVEALQELAEALGRDPEGTLVDSVDEVLAKVGELENSVTALTSERDELAAKVKQLDSKLLKDAENFQRLANAVGLPFSTIMREIKQPGKKLMFVNDETLAKLEQPQVNVQNESNPETSIGIAILALGRAYGLPGNLRTYEIIERVIALAPQLNEKPAESKGDTVYRAMQNAASYYNSINGQFNGACFSRALMELAGLEGNIDGKLVYAILAGRNDVEVLHGESHYRIREQPQPTGEVLFDEVANYTKGSIDVHISSGVSGARMTYQNKNGNPYRVTIREVQ